MTPQKRDALIKAAVEWFDANVDNPDSLDLDEEVHDDKADEASDINNEGTESQIRYLVERRGDEWLKQILKEEKAR